MPSVAGGGDPVLRVVGDRAGFVGVPGVAGGSDPVLRVVGDRAGFVDVPSVAGGGTPFSGSLTRTFIRYLRGERGDEWSASLGDGVPRLLEVGAGYP